MTELPKINDDKTLREWLKGRPPSDAVIIAHRAAMRVLPVSCAAMRKDSVRKYDLAAVPVLRLNLALGVQLKDPASKAAAYGVGAYGAAAYGAAAADADAAAADAAAAAAAAASGAPVWDAVVRDAVDLVAGHDLTDTALWPSDNPLAAIWVRAQRVLRETPGGNFWIDWYQRALDGRPQNWPLLRDVSVIDDALWERGGEALDSEISRVVERHQLLEEVRRLKSELAEARTSTAAHAHIGHNNPPESIDLDFNEIAAGAEAIAEELDLAEQELEQPKPSPSVLRRIGQHLKAMALSVGGYCLKLADLGAQSFAKWVGTSLAGWSGAEIVSYFGSNSEALKTLAEALIKFAGQ